MTPEAKQPYEIHANEIVVEGLSTPDYPLQKKRHSVEFLRTIAHLRPRTNTFSAVFRVRSVAAFAIHKFFNERGFVYVHTPIITGSDCEGAGEMFHITTLDMDNPPRTEDGKVDYSQDFFGKPTSLTVSGQLEGECMAMAFGKVYTFGPTFRAEKSYTTAPRGGVLDDGAGDRLRRPAAMTMELAEDMMKFVLPLCDGHLPAGHGILQPVLSTKELLEDRLHNVVHSDFRPCDHTPRRSELLGGAQGRILNIRSSGVAASDLRTRAREIPDRDRSSESRVFVTDYPKEIKAFYMRLNDDGKTVAAADLLVPGIGEIIGGSQREERYDVLLDRIRELGLNEEDYCLVPRPAQIRRHQARRLRSGL